LVVLLVKKLTTTKKKARTTVEKLFLYKCHCHEVGPRLQTLKWKVSFGSTGSHPSPPASHSPYHSDGTFSNMKTDYNSET
jgi:hypothetical protein